MTASHPFEARRGGDLPEDYLPCLGRAMLLQAPRQPGENPGLLRMVDLIRDARALRQFLILSLRSAAAADPEGAALLAETEAADAGAAPFLDGWSARGGAVLARLIADDPFDPAEAWRLPDRLAALSLMRALAALPLIRCKFAGENAPIPLAAAPLARPALPPLREGATEAVEVVDLHRPAPPEQAVAGLRVRFLHGVDIGAARVAEAVAGMAPERFAEAVDRLRETSPDARLGAVMARLAGLGLPLDAVAARAGSADVAAAVARDVAMAACCGVPVWRPLVAVGRDVFFGPDIAPARAGGPAWRPALPGPQAPRLTVVGAMKIYDIDFAMVLNRWVRAPFSTAANADPNRPVLAVWRQGGGTVACWAGPRSGALEMAVEGEEARRTAGDLVGRGLAVNAT